MVPGYPLSPSSSSGLCFLIPGGAEEEGVHLPPLGGAFPWQPEGRAAPPEWSPGWEAAGSLELAGETGAWGQDALKATVGWVPHGVGQFLERGFLCQLASSAHRWGPWEAGGEALHSHAIPLWTQLGSQGLVGFSHVLQSCCSEILRSVSFLPPPSPPLLPLPQGAESSSLNLAKVSVFTLGFWPQI